MKTLPRWHFLIATVALTMAPSLLAQSSAPKPLTFTAPKYPAELIDSGLGGQAEINVTVKADGSVANPALKSSDHPAFGTEAMAVIEQWKFTPGQRDGVAVDTVVTIPFQFRAPFDQKINAMAKRKVYLQLPEPAMTQKDYKSKLKVKAKARPVFPAALAKSGLKEDVKVNFVVTPEGTVVNPQLEKEPSNPLLIVPTIAAISQVTFDPPKKSGKGVYVEATETLHFEEPPPAPPGEKGGRGGKKGGKGGGGGDPDGPPAGDP